MIVYLIILSAVIGVVVQSCVEKYGERKAKEAENQQCKQKQTTYLHGNSLDKRRQRKPELVKYAPADSVGNGELDISYVDGMGGMNLNISVPICCAEMVLSMSV